ncbi:tRNA-specific adenosine deaminase, partial [Citrobacter sp. TBCS-11]
NPKFGGTVSLYQILEDKRLNHRVQVESGILEYESAKIMQDFFKNRRKK